MFKENFASIEEFIFWEEAITEKVKKILSPQSLYQKRFLRLEKWKRQALYLYSLPLLSRKYALYLNSEKLSHKISLWAPHLTPDFQKAIQHIIFLPEIYKTYKYLLSHIYIPKLKALLFYLTPEAFLSQKKEETSLLPQRFLETKESLCHIGLHGKAFFHAIHCYRSQTKKSHIFLQKTPKNKNKEFLFLEKIEEEYAILKYK